MTDQDNVTDLARTIVLAAINAAGPADDRWKVRINDLVPQIASMLNDSSPQMRSATRMLNSAQFVAKFVSMEIEQSSTRGLVTLETQPSKRYPDGLEPIRTDRGDTAAGRRMIERLSKLAPSTPIMVWKAMEHAGDNEVRILAHFEVLGKPDMSEPSQPVTSTTASPRKPAEPVSVSDPVIAAYHDALDQLSTTDKVAFAKKARAVGITNVMAPGDHLLQALDILAEIQQGTHYGEPF